MSFRQHVQSYRRQVRQDHPSDEATHPQTETLRAYHRGLLDGLEEDRVQEHLVNCSECTSRFLGLVNFLEWNLDSTRLAEDDLTRSWQVFLQKRRARSGSKDSTIDEERELSRVSQD